MSNANPFSQVVAQHPWAGPDVITGLAAMVEAELKALRDDEETAADLARAKVRSAWVAARQSQADRQPISPDPVPARPVISPDPNPLKPTITEPLEPVRPMMPEPKSPPPLTEENERSLRWAVRRRGTAEAAWGVIQSSAPTVQEKPLWDFVETAQTATARESILLAQTNALIFVTSTDAAISDSLLDVVEKWGGDYRKAVQVYRRSITATALASILDETVPGTAFEAATEDFQVLASQSLARAAWKEVRARTFEDAPSRDLFFAINAAQLGTEAETIRAWRGHAMRKLMGSASGLNHDLLMVMQAWGGEFAEAVTAYRQQSA